MEKSSLDIPPNISICVDWKKKVSIFIFWVIYSFNRNIRCILDYSNKHEQEQHIQVEEEQGYLEAMPSFKTSSYFSVDKIEKSEQVHILAAVAARDQNARSCREWQTTSKHSSYPCWNCHDNMIERDITRFGDGTKHQTSFIWPKLLSDWSGKPSLRGRGHYHLPHYEWTFQMRFCDPVCFPTLVNEMKSE